MRKTLKKAALPILLSVTASLLLSCAGGNPAATTTEAPSQAGTTATEAASAQLQPDLPEKDYGGYEFRMLMRNSDRWVSDMYAEGETGELINDAVYRRNALIGDEFNVTFSVTRSSNDNAETDALKSILAGEDAYDIIVPHARMSFEYARVKTLLDWNTDLPYVDLDKPWWDANARENLSIGGKLYTMTGDISFRCLGNTNAMLFNKKLFTDMSIEFPYQAVLDGTWTFDKFEAIVKQGSADLNGDSKYTKEDDSFGYVTNEWIGPIQVLYTGGERIIQKDEDDLPYLSLYNDNTVNIFGKFFGMIKNDNCLVSAWPSTDDRDVFVEDRALFTDMNFDKIIELRAMNSNFGIIPWPKFDETLDRYYTNVDAGCNLFCIPITVSDTERTSIILEALAAEGYNSVTPAFYEVSLRTKFTRDDESAGMLDIIKEGRVFDLGYFNGGFGELSSVGRNLAMGASQDFTSYYDKYEAQTKTLIEKVIKEYTE